VQLAASSIADQHKKSDAMPLFDVNGANVGYVAGAVFYAQSIQTTPPAVGTEEKRESRGIPAWMWWAGLGGLVLIGGVAAMAAGGGGSRGGGDGPSAPPPGTATAPSL
jgi:hypothetical protein